MTFGEDDSRIRQGHAPENFTLLRRLAISALNPGKLIETQCTSKVQISGDEPRLHDESACQCGRLAAILLGKRKENKFSSITRELHSLQFMTSTPEIFSLFSLTAMRTMDFQR